MLVTEKSWLLRLQSEKMAAGSVPKDLLRGQFFYIGVVRIRENSWIAQPEQATKLSDFSTIPIGIGGLSPHCAQTFPMDLHIFSLVSVTESCRSQISSTLHHQMLLRTQDPFCTRSLCQPTCGKTRMQLDHVPTPSTN